MPRRSVPSSQQWLYAGLCLASLFAPARLYAGDAEPTYDLDPFHDADFVQAPLVRDVAHPTRGRWDFGLMFSSSLIDKYVQQTGATIDLRYHFAHHWGIGASFSYYGGSYTGIVAEPAGVIGNKVSACRNAGATSCDLTLHLPDTQQVTGSFDVNLIWLPLYGKLNIVSELDSDVQLYVLAGGGVNGTRTFSATYDTSATNGYTLASDGGGLFANSKAHASLGLGASLFLTRWLAVRGEIRSMVWHSNLDPDGDGTTQGYVSWRHMAMIGLVLVPQ